MTASRLRLRSGARATLLVTCAVYLITTLLGAEAQPAGKVARVGFLWTSSPELTTRALDAFRQGLREAGYIEGFPGAPNQQVERTACRRRSPAPLAADVKGQRVGISQK
jgi:hypothetical protein